jgi:putative phosphoserine phosphatase/1-acylglycerol-3-phosphate O-acyltransferase
MNDTGARKPRLLDVLRTFAALAAILPGLLAGLWILLRRRNRRQALNRAIELWGDLGTRAAGIELRVEGAEYLELRPAVFVINHQSGIDPMLVCALLRRNFVGVAKVQIKSNPVLGPAFSFAETIFLDREDGEAARRSLAAAVETLNSGLAVVVAPEGTRSDSAAPGRFKAGAFRLALEARVPMIPIVIHDAFRVLPSGAFVMRAGSVHVSVQPPVSTTDWTAKSIHHHVGAVERVFQKVISSARWMVLDL